MVPVSTVFGVCVLEALEVYGLEVLHSELSVDVWEPDGFTMKSWGVFFGIVHVLNDYTF